MTTRSERNARLFADLQARAKDRGSIYFWGSRIKGGFLFTEILNSGVYSHIDVSLDGEVRREWLQDIHVEAIQDFRSNRKLRKRTLVRAIINPWRVDRYYSQNHSKDPDNFNYTSKAKLRRFFSDQYEIRPVEVWRITPYKLLVGQHDAQYMYDYAYLTDNETIGVVEIELRKGSFATPDQIASFTKERAMLCVRIGQAARVSINLDQVLEYVGKLQEGYFVN